MQKKHNEYLIKKFLSPLLKLHFCWFCLVACHNQSAEKIDFPSYEVTPAYYHWQTVLALSETEKRHLDSLHSSKLYIKFFDIDISQGSTEPFPIARLQLDSNSFIPNIIIPTVFITNRSLLNLDATQVKQLAQRLHRLIGELAQPLGTISIPEVQIDCDWSQQTKDNYFLLLKTLREQHLSSDQKLSATIRLHQLKYPDQTGIPPVDRGMLMFYNMGEVTQWQEHNSILNLETAAQYIGPASPYSIPLDLALPLFRWGVLFREGKMIKLINELGAEQLQDTTRFSPIDNSRFQVIKSTYLDGYYLYHGDQIRLEASKLSDLQEAVEMLNSYFPRKSFTLAYYHLDMPVVKRFSHTALSDLVEQFETRE